MKHGRSSKFKLSLTMTTTSLRSLVIALLSSVGEAADGDIQRKADVELALRLRGEMEKN